MRKIQTGGTLEGLLAAMQDAASDYFDKIEIDSENLNTVNCYVGETCFLKIGINAYTGMTITTSAGATTTINGVNYPINEIYTCESGIFLAYAELSNGWYYGFIVIGLDAEGNVCVASNHNYTGTITYNGSGSQMRYIISASVDDTEISSYSVENNKRDELTGKTALSPVYTQGSYMQGIWVPLMFQFSVNPPNPILITGEGKSYLQSVLFILDDGEA